MNRSCLLACLCLLIWTVPVNAQTSLSPWIHAIKEGQAQGAEMSEVLAKELDDSYEHATQIIGSAIAVSPGSVEEIVRIAVAEGIEAEPIAAQCETSLTRQQREQLIKTALNERVDPRPIFRYCMVLVPPSEWPELIALAINNSTPGGIERILQSAYSVMEPVSEQAFMAVREGLLRSEAFAVEGLELHDEMDDLLVEIRTQDDLEVLVEEEATNIDEIADADVFEEPDAGEPDGNGGPTEPPFSDS